MWTNIPKKKKSNTAVAYFTLDTWIIPVFLPFMSMELHYLNPMVTSVTRPP